MSFEELPLSQVPHFDKNSLAFLDAEFSGTPEDVWTKVRVLAQQGPVVTVRTENALGKVLNVDLLNAEMVPANKSVVPDLTSLYFMNEAAILENLEKRSYADEPYTFMANVLVAVNPLKTVHDFSDFLGSKKAVSLIHPYSIAEQAYQQLCFRAGQNDKSEEKVSQSVVMSGESGAGKTESSKKVLRHILFRCSDGGDQLSARLLESNEILESFGNAGTLRNHNSSRFGKFIQLWFSHKDMGNTKKVAYTVEKATIITFLLEKSRITMHGVGEYNYHVFYYLFQTRSELKDKLLLDKKSFLEDPGSNSNLLGFRYLDPSHEENVEPVERDDIDDDDVVEIEFNVAREKDAKNFKSLVNALSVFGLDQSFCDSLFSVLGGIIHLGNVRFKDVFIKNENLAEEDTEMFRTNFSALEKAAELFEIDGNDLHQLLTTRKVMAAKEVSIVKLDSSAASVARDSVARSLYSSIFDWLLLKLRENLMNHGENVKAGVEPVGFIGILDIFGFEVFERNGFEQLLINYANEALQETFNKSIFLSELELYKKEGLMDDESEGDMELLPPDNSSCLSLFKGMKAPEEQKSKKVQRLIKMGLLRVLDAETWELKSSDLKLCATLHQGFDSNESFGRLHPLQRKSHFVVRHFAGAVTYEATAFIRKNKDSIPAEMLNVLESSNNQTIQLVVKMLGDSLPKEDPTSGKTKQKRKRKKTVAGEFSGQIKDLIKTLEQTSTSFIRCVKPNAALFRGDASTWFNRSYVATQLRSLAIPQTVRVLSRGFPTRLDYSRLVNDLKDRLPLEQTQKWAGSMAETSSADQDKMLIEALFFAFGIERDAYKLGRTKVFFKSGQISNLEKVLASEWGKEDDEIATRFRRFYVRKRLRIVIAKVFAMSVFGRMLEKIRARRKRVRRRWRVVIKAAVAGQEFLKLYETVVETRKQKAEEERKRLEAEKKRLEEERIRLEEEERQKQLALQAEKELILKKQKEKEEKERLRQLEIQRQKEQEEAEAEAQRQLDLAAKKDEEKEVTVPEQTPVQVKTPEVPDQVKTPEASPAEEIVKDITPTTSDEKPELAVEVKKPEVPATVEGNKEGEAAVASEKPTTEADPGAEVKEVDEEEAKRLQAEEDEKEKKRLKEIEEEEKKLKEYQAERKKLIEAEDKRLAALAEEWEKDRAERDRRMKEDQAAWQKEKEESALKTQEMLQEIEEDKKKDEEFLKTKRNRNDKINKLKRQITQRSSVFQKLQSVEEKQEYLDPFNRLEALVELAGNEVLSDEEIEIRAKEAVDKLRKQRDEENDRMRRQMMLFAKGRGQSFVAEMEGKLEKAKEKDEMNYARLVKVEIEKLKLRNTVTVLKAEDSLDNDDENSNPNGKIVTNKPPQANQTLRARLQDRERNKLNRLSLRSHLTHSTVQTAFKSDADGLEWEEQEASDGRIALVNPKTGLVRLRTRHSRDEEMTEEEVRLQRKINQIRKHKQTALDSRRRTMARTAHNVAVDLVRKEEMGRSKGLSPRLREEKIQKATEKILSDMAAQKVDADDDDDDDDFGFDEDFFDEEDWLTKNREKKKNVFAKMYQSTKGQDWYKEANSNAKNVLQEAVLSKTRMQRVQKQSAEGDKEEIRGNVVSRTLFRKKKGKKKGNGGGMMKNIFSFRKKKGAPKPEPPALKFEEKVLEPEPEPQAEQVVAPPIRRGRGGSANIAKRRQNNRRGSVLRNGHIVQRLVEASDPLQSALKQFDEIERLGETGDLSPEEVLQLKSELAEKAQEEAPDNTRGSDSLVVVSSRRKRPSMKGARGRGSVVAYQAASAAIICKSCMQKNYSGNGAFCQWCHAPLKLSPAVNIFELAGDSNKSGTMMKRTKKDDQKEMEYYDSLDWDLNARVNGGQLRMCLMPDETSNICSEDTGVEMTFFTTLCVFERDPDPDQLSKKRQSVFTDEEEVDHRKFVEWRVLHIFADFANFNNELRNGKYKRFLTAKQRKEMTPLAVVKSNLYQKQSFGFFADALKNWFKNLQRALSTDKISKEFFQEAGRFWELQNNLDVDDLGAGYISDDDDDSWVSWD